MTAEAEQESIVDFVLHPVLLDPDTAAIAEILSWRAAASRA